MASSRPSTQPKGRPASLFGSLRSLRSLDHYEEPLSATSITPSIHWTPLGENAIPPSREVLHHGEVQTSSSMFRKKREYLVLTETHIVRVKSQQKAADTFPSISPSNGKGLYARHRSTNSGGSLHDLQSFTSEASGDKDYGISLRQVVAVYNPGDGKPYFAIEVACLDEEVNQASIMTLQFDDPNDRDAWFYAIKSAATQVSIADDQPISPYNLNLAARTVEAENDYDPSHFLVYKVVVRPAGKSSTRSSADDLSKIVSTVCFLVIGVHKIHLIPLFKSPNRSSSPALHQPSNQGSFGILSMSAVSLLEAEDPFELSFRQPLKANKVIHLASLAAPDIVDRLLHVERCLRPGWVEKPYALELPPSMNEKLVTLEDLQLSTAETFERTLIAYCVAYGTDPAHIRYQVSERYDNTQCFELLPPVGAPKVAYHELELLAVMRALRYNIAFNSISFAKVSLDPLRRIYDPYGTDYMCIPRNALAAYPSLQEDFQASSLLVSETRLLAMANTKLRGLDFDSCIKQVPREPGDDDQQPNDGCALVEALIPLCKTQLTNVDWIGFNNIQLGELDIEYIVDAAADRACHFRALELSNCGLNDRSLSLVLDALRAQENTLESIDFSRSAGRLSPAIFEGQIGVFGYLRSLNLSYLSTTGGNEALIPAEILMKWNLQKLALSGSPISGAMLDAIAVYLESPKSSCLQELRLDHTAMTGGEMAKILLAMTKEEGSERELHLDLSENRPEKDHRLLSWAISNGHAPSNLTIKYLEYENESLFRELILALGKNRTIRSLDISKAKLPHDASDETCNALEALFKYNTSLVSLDISGEDSKLETSKLGVGLNQALHGLKENKALRSLSIQYQMLGLPGASTLADVLKINDTLQYLFCEHNAIPLSGFTDLINTLYRNTSILYLPEMQEGRDDALRQTESQVKAIQDDAVAHTPGKSSVRTKLARTARPSHRRQSSSISFSDQDIQAALRLVEESWDRQVYRLRLYMYRNNCIAQGIPAEMEILEEEYERPDDAMSSTGRILEQVKSETTPRVEKELELGKGEQSRDTNGEEMSLTDEIELMLGWAKKGEKA
ncbi:RNI-like protein [Eremomyces bilateralis CBS 781.70]|uniref:RNI-like protein n=1 Tax=Eremomyces bilateralis CBS 781.70 TaxID=1392243 RepID=A0A6G1G6F0_9PEZI|nr:RNI-like protein [Eremomyces bilateralis CBS 781.70]KAF1813531.1 RNI-like protein [Eremomyces bilateralis CBS 781.70]